MPGVSLSRQSRLFYIREEEPLLVVTMFHDRSWIVQQGPVNREPPVLGTREDGHHIVDLIHQTLDMELATGQWPPED